MKKMITYIITVVVLVALILIIGLLIYMNNKTQRNVVEIKDFSCSGMDGFTFKYPVFKGWEVRNVSKQNDDRCIVVFKWPNKDIYPEVSPSMIIQKEYKIGLNYFKKKLIEGIPSPEVKKNSSGVLYDVLKYSKDKLNFYGDNFGVSLELSISETLGDGFDKNLFFRTVIDSFKLVDKESENEPSEKRLPPKDVSPVFYEGMKFVSSFIDGDEQPTGGLVSAFSEKDNKLIWDKLVYSVKLDQDIEIDAQYVYISQLFIENGKLIVIDEDNRRYQLNPFSGEIIK